MQPKYSIMKMKQDGVEEGAEEGAVKSAERGSEDVTTAK